MEAAGYTCEGLLMDDAGLTSWKMRIPAGSAAV
jgi:hypothetical protein